MRRPTIKNEYLKKVMRELKKSFEDAPDELYERLDSELKHSCLIIPGDVRGDQIKLPTAEIGGMKFIPLFTDMDEFRKAFPDFGVESRENPFATYLKMLRKSDLHGIIINLESEMFVLTKDCFEENMPLPETEYSDDDSYTSDELKNLKDHISNDDLENFLENPKNVGRYEELFEMISNSTVLTLMVSRHDLTCHASNGVISMKENPMGFIYIDKTGGEYATLYTSEEKMDYVNTPLNKYSQIVNFSQLTNFSLYDDLDGIIINPNSDNIVLTRDILLEFSPMLERTCNDHRLNSAIYHMFVMEA